ncbi:MAG: hypothetical protein HYX75_22795 [Acidobacteria bacterium]|nr:hypothetical protein [Acidobacteriota bacterium]
MLLRAAKVFCLLFLVFIGTPCWGLDPSKALTQYRHDVWQTRDGLPQSSVESMVQTRTGYLWLGTQEGLARFDGVRFAVYDKSNTKAIRHNRILALLEDRRGSLWIGTEGGGLVELSDGLFRNFSKSEGLPDERVLALAEDHDGRLWVGTGSGLACYRDGTVDAGRSVPELIGTPIESLAVAANGKLWIGTAGRGLFRYDHAQVERVGPDGEAQSTVAKVFCDADGSVWFASNARLYRLQEGPSARVDEQSWARWGSIGEIYRDRQGSLWVGTDAGVVRFRDGRVESYSVKDGLSNDVIHCILEDHEGSLWIGTMDGGLNRFADGAFTTYSTAEGLSHDIVSPIYQDREGRIWIGTRGGGVNCYAREGFTTYTARDGLADDFVQAIVQDREGTLWFGTKRGGLCSLREGRFKTYTDRDGLPIASVRALFEDRRGDLWVGTLNHGLARFRDGGFQLFTTKDGLTNNTVFFILEDHEGTVWFATNGGGLNYYRDGRFGAITTKEGLSIDIVNTLHEDAAGTLWIGTYGGGLNRLTHGRLSSYTTREGLFDDAVFRILEDGSGNLWISCNKGIYRIAKHQFDELDRGGRRLLEPAAFGVVDGMKNRECNGADQPTGWKMRDGTLWFPTIQGAVMVDPAHLPTNTLPPAVVIEELRVDDRVAGIAATPEIPPGAQRVDIQYAGLSFRVPARVRFRYKLEGFDGDWVDAGARRTAYYTRLPPGSYRFRVQACNDSGVWNTVGATLGLVIIPHIYQRPLFYFALMAVAAILVISIHRLRVQRLKRRERELVEIVEQRTQSLRLEMERTARALREAEEQREIAHAAKTEAEAANRIKSWFVANTSHELRTPINSVLGYSEMLIEEAEESGNLVAIPDLRKIHAAGRHLLGLINDILDLSKIEAGKLDLQLDTFDLGALVEEVAASVRPLIEKNGNALAADGTDVAGSICADPARARQILLNLLSNAAKFTRDGEVRLEVRRETDRVLMRVIDTGIGMTSDQIARLFQAYTQAGADTSRKYGGTGLGLVISRRLAQMMGGEISVESAPGKGSTFTLTLPARTPAGEKEDRGGSRMAAAQ